MLAEGTQVRYTGDCVSLLGKVGLFCLLMDYDLYCGEPLGLVPGFEHDEGADYVELGELEEIE